MFGGGVVESVRRFFCFYFPFVFLELHLQHMEVPRLGVQSKLQLPAYATATAMPDPRSATYATAHGNAESLAHRGRPGIESMSSWILVGFITAVPQRELLRFFFFFFFFFGVGLIYNII